MANLKNIYSDIDFTFTKRPVVGDVAISYDQQAVIRSIRNLLLTKHFERPFNPDLGANIDALLFEPVSGITSSLLENEIKTTIQNFEPRATLQSVVVQVDPDHNYYQANINFYVKNETAPMTVNLVLQRLR